MIAAEYSTARLQAQILQSDHSRETGFGKFRYAANPVILSLVDGKRLLRQVADDVKGGTSSGGMVFE
jgi:hypothetical protein